MNSLNLIFIGVVLLSSSVWSIMRYLWSWWLGGQWKSCFISILWSHSCQSKAVFSLFSFQFLYSFLFFYLFFWNLIVRMFQYRLDIDSWGGYLILHRICIPLILSWYDQPHDIMSFSPAWAFLLFPLMLVGVVASRLLSIMPLNSPRAVTVFFLGQQVEFTLSWEGICIHSSIIITYRLYVSRFGDLYDVFLSGKLIINIWF